MAGLHLLKMIPPLKDEKDAVIKELQNRLAHAEALLNRDGSNTGTPTSQTPVSKTRIVPNSRRKINPYSVAEISFAGYNINKNFYDFMEILGCRK